MASNPPYGVLCRSLIVLSVFCSTQAVVVDYSARWLRVALPSSIASAVRGTDWRVDM